MAPTQEWLAAKDGIVRDMQAHLKRRKKRAEADLIGRGLIGRVIDFFGSQYFRNVRKSAGVFFGAYVWYVLNSNSYTPPEYDD